jgi:hypothetical protein
MIRTIQDLMYVDQYEEILILLMKRCFVICLSLTTLFLVWNFIIKDNNYLYDKY